MMPIQKFYWRSFDPHGRYWYQAWRTIGVALVALGLWHFVLLGAMGEWLVIAAVVLLQIRLGVIWWQQAFTIGVVGVIVCLVAMLLTLLPGIWWWPMILVGVVTFFAVLAALISREVSVAGVLLVLLVILVD